MKPFTVARTRDNLLRDGEAFGAEIRSAARLLASLLHQEYDLDPDAVQAFRLEFEIDPDTSAPCSLALFEMEDPDPEEDEDDPEDDEI